MLTFLCSVLNIARWLPLSRLSLKSQPVWLEIDWASQEDWSQFCVLTVILVTDREMIMLHSNVFPQIQSFLPMYGWKNINQLFVGGWWQTGFYLAASATPVLKYKIVSIFKRHCDFLLLLLLLYFYLIDSYSLKWTDIHLRLGFLSLSPLPWFTGAIFWCFDRTRSCKCP